MASSTNKKFDEFGIPIRTTNNEVDEFGIPLKKKGQEATGGVSPSGSVPTQPGNGLSVSQSGDVTPDNRRINVKFYSKTNPKVQPIGGAIGKFATTSMIKTESDLTPEDVEYITGELLTKAQATKGYDADFFATKSKDGVNKDYATKFLRENAARITYKNNKPLTNKDIEVLNTRWIEKLSNQKTLKPYQVDNAMNKLWMGQTKKENPNLYKQLNPPAPQTVQKGKELKWEETTKDAGYFDKDLLGSLTESEKNALGSFLIQNKGVKQKMDRFNYGSVPKELQKDVIAQALGKQAQEAAARIQIYADKGDTEKMKKLSTLQNELTSIQAQQKILQNSINENDFDNTNMPPEQKAELEGLKSQYQVLKTEYTNDKNDFESLKKEMQPVFDRITQLEQGLKESPEFITLKAKIDPIIKQLEALSPLVQQGDTNAIIRNNQLVEYYKNDFQKYDALAKEQDAKFQEYKLIYDENKSNIDLYNERIKSLTSLETEMNSKADEFNAFVTRNNPQQLSKVDQYKLSIDKYNNLVNKAAPLYEEYKNLYGELGEQAITDIGESVLKLNQFSDFQKRMEAEREPSMREMMLNSPFNNTKILDYTVFPFVAETAKFVSQSIAGGIKVVGELGETLTFKPEDYYSFADWASDVVQFGYDGTGKYWTDTVLPGLRKSDFVDPFTGELVYSPASVIVGSFEQMGQIAGAALTTYGSMGLGMGRNAAIVTPMFLATYENNIGLAKQLGFEGSGATQAGILFSMIEGFSELIFPDIDFFQGAAKKEAFKMFLDNFSKGGARMATKRFLETTGKELGEEYVVELGKYMATMSTRFFNGQNKVYELDPAQLLETTIFVFTSAGTGAAVQAKLTTSKTFNESMMFRMAMDLETSIPMIEQYNTLGKINNEKAEALKKNLKVISAIQGQLPKDISTPKKIVISGLYAQIVSLEEKINDPNLTEEIKDSYKQSTKKMKALIAQVMMTDDAEFTKRYNEEMEAQGKAVSEEISKAHPDLGVATSYLDRGKQIQLSEQDQLRMQILDDIFKDSSAQNKADALEQRMNNAEEISMTEINKVLDGLYKQVEMVMDNYFDNEAGKQYVQALLDKIDKIKSYEFATDKETAVVTERKAVQTARASLQETASVINLARAPRRTATITSEDGTTGTYSIEVGPDGTVTFEQPNTEPIRIGNVNDVNKTASIVETVLNEQGLPQSVSFSITDEQGKSHTIKVEAKANLKPQQLLDLAINIRANELGTVDPTDFDEAYEEVTREVEVGKTYPNMPVLGEMSDEEYFDFLDNGNVSNERIMDIARKVMTNQELTPQENEIFTDKTAEINQVIKTYKPYRNAVQEQAAGQVPVQPTTRPSQEMAQGKPQAKPQEAAQKGKVQVAPVAQQETVESVRLKSKRANLDKVTENVLAFMKEADIDVRIIEDEAEFDAAVGMGGTNGLFDDQNGVVYVNPSRMKLAQQGNRVLFHESTHPVLNILYNTDKSTYDRIMKGMMDAAKKGIPMWQDLQNFRQRYIDRGYSEEQADNELMTETIGRIINGEIGLNDIPVGWRQAIVDMLNKIAKLLGIKPIGAVTDAGKFRDFAASLKDAFEKGRSISTIVGAENVKKFQSPFVEEQLSIMGIDQAQFLEMTKQMATDVESMVVPGNITNGWIQTGTKGGEQVVKFTGEATLENIRQHAIDSYINRAYNLAQYDLSGIDVKGDFINKLVGIDAKQKALFEKSFFNVARTEIQKIIDSSKLNKAEKDTKEDLDRKKRTKDALKQALKINDIGQLYDAIEAIGKDMDVISSSLITSLYQKRDFVYDETIKAKIDRWNDQKKRGVREADWVTKKISELVFAKRNNEAMANEADGIYENMKTKVKENLRFIYDLVNPAIRNLTKLWYDGANVIAQEFGSKYNLSLEQTAGIIASQSPQMPWFSNLHLAQTIMDIMMTKGNEVFTKQQYDYYVAAAKGYAKQRAYIPTVKGLIGKRLNELSDYDAGIFIRSYYDLNMSRKAPKRLPSGVIVSYETGDSSFSSYDTIEKGVSIFRDGSVENISANLGEANKVRNFYNNIVDPTNINSVTIDTHAMAVSLIMPFGASDTEIKFDSGSYAFYSDSYNELARELNLGARELQSITWEAIRAFFPDNVKTAKFKGEIADIWNRYSKGIITIDQARNEILNKGKDANKTEWSDSIQDWMDGKTGTDYFRPIDRKGDVPGTASGRASQGIGGGVPTVAGADIREGRDVLGRKPSVGRKTKGQPSLVEGQEFESTINGETVVLKPVDVDVVNGFYSPLEQEVFSSKQDKMPAKKWLDRFKGREEAKWTGLNDWLESQDKAVSKQDILDYMKQNRVLISEVVLGALKQTWIKNGNEYVSAIDNRYRIVDIGDNEFEVYRGKTNIGSYDGLSYAKEKAEENGLQSQDVNLSDNTKYSQIQLEGEKEYYREVLVTLPSNQPISVKEYNDARDELDAFEKSINRPTEEDKLRYSELSDKIEELKSKLPKNAFIQQGRAYVGKEPFQSSHFDEPNILVHLRMNERIDAEGNKVLFLEEVQSDWAQKGRREGFAQKEQKPKKLEQLSREQLINMLAWNDPNGIYTDEDSRREGYEPMTKEEALEKVNEMIRSEGDAFETERFLRQGSMVEGIPTAPFVMNTSDWVKLAMRVALKEAVKSGANSIAWTTGEQQNDRNNLSKQVDEIIYTKNNDNTFDLYAIKNGQTVSQNFNKTIKEIESIVGKDIADKILNKEGVDVEGTINNSLKGDNLKVGGKGMIDFYGNATKPGIVGQVASKLFGQEVVAVEINDVEQPSVTVTPQMKAEVKRGLPQFSLMEVEKPNQPTLKAAGLTPAEVEQWKKKNKVSQREGRVTGVQKSAQDLYEGKITIYQHIQNVRKEQPAKTYQAVPQLPTYKDVTSSLAENQMETGVVGLNKGITQGTQVGARLDIPSFNNYGTNVVSIHEATGSGKAIGYGRTASLSNVKFKTSPSAALKVAMGESKGTWARMIGSWNNESDQSVVDRAKQAISSGEWIQIGINPFRHSWFYNRATGMPVMEATEVLQVGNMVLARGARELNLNNAKDKAEFEETFKVKLKSGAIGQFSLMGERDVAKRLEEVGRNNYDKLIDIYVKNRINGRPLRISIQDMMNEEPLSLTFNNVEPFSREPYAVQFSDGWPMVRLTDGRYTDGDLIYESWDQLIELNKDNIDEYFMDLETDREIDVRNDVRVKQIENNSYDSLSDIGFWNKATKNLSEYLGYASPMQMQEESPEDAEIAMNLTAKAVDLYNEGKIKTDIDFYTKVLGLTNEEAKSKIKNVSFADALSQMYVESKKRGSNPGLVKAVEDAIGKPRGQASLMDDPAPIIEQFGRKAESFADAEQALSNGDYVFLYSEMDGIPYIANDIQSLKANYDQVIIVKKEDYPIPAASKDQVDKINKKLKRGQPSLVDSTVLGNPAAMAQQQYPLYQAMLPLGMDAFDNGARDVEAFMKYLGAIQWPNEISRDYHTMTVWDDVIRIKENKKPLINSQSDYEKMVRNLSYSHASNVQEINKKKSKIRKQFFKEKTWFDSRASFFKALARQSGELWNIVSAYTHTIGGMTEKGIFQANLFMSTTYDGLSNTQNIPYNGMLYSERMLLDEMLTLFGYIETNRKMQDKFNEFIQVEQDYRNETDPAKKEALKDQRDILKDYLDRNNVLSGNGRSIPYSLSDFKRSNLDMMSANVKLSNLSTAYPELFDKLSKRADAYFEAWKTLLKMRLDAGMISQESFDEMEKYNYVPTKFVGYLLRDISNETDVKLNESTTKQIERLMGGSEDQLVMAHDESLKFAAMAVSRSIQKNRAVQALSRAIDANPNAITFYKPEAKRDKYGNATEWVYDSKTKGLIKYYVDGKLEAIATEKEVADAFNGKQEAFDMPEGLGWLFMSTPFRMVTTNLNPAFGLAQIVIDLNQALLANDAYATVLYGAPAVLFRDLKLLSGRGLTWVSKKIGLPVNLDSEWNELFTEAREYGALISFTQSETFETALERKAGLNSRTDKFLNGDNMFAKTKRGIEEFNTSLEYVTRLAIYRKVRNNLIDKYIKDNNGNKPVGQALDDIRTEAAAASMNMLNYNRGGTWIKPLNRVMAYLNVGFQVPYSIFQNFKKSPYLTSLKASELIVYGALAMAQLYRMLDDDDKKKFIEYYNRLSPYEKSSYWHYPNPFRDPKDPDTFLSRFKKPSILLPMINTVEVIAMYSVTDGKTQSLDNYLTSVPDAYTTTLAKDFYDAQPFKAGVVSSMPTVNAAMIGFGNFDLYRMQYVVPKEEQIANPREGLEDPNVSQFYKYLSQINVEPKYMASGNVLSPKRMDEATKALIGDYTRNPVTSYPSLVFGAVMNAASTGYRDANKFVPEQPEKSLVNTIIEGSGFTQRFSTRISPLKPVTKKTINEQQVLKNAIYDTIRLTLDGMIQREERPDRYLIRQYFTDNLENQREMFTVEEYETLLEKIVMYSQRGSKIKEIEDRYLWVKPFILAPSKVEKSIIWESETSNYTYDEKIEVLRWLVLNDLFIPGKDMQLDESIAKDLKKFRK